MYVTLNLPCTDASTLDFITEIYVAPLHYSDYYSEVLWTLAWLERKALSLE